VLLSPGAAGLVSSLLVPEFKIHLTDIVFDDQGTCALREEDW
jgi:hypothetical protein